MAVKENLKRALLRAQRKARTTEAEAARKLERERAHSSKLFADNNLLTDANAALTADLEASDAIVVVQQSNLDLTVNLIRVRAFHILAHTQTVLDALATYTDEDTTAAEAALNHMRDEANGDLENFPEGWPD